MLERIAHRGPDDEGAVRVDGSWLGHRRLSIVDVEGGHQPLGGEDEGLWLVGNGEVYNHEEVRARLAGREFRTASDNEVALHLLEEEGPDALGDLHGMYAFLAAGEDGRFVAVRDPLGIKPLFWARRGGSVRFASEMRAFDPEWRPHIEAFPPGCYWTPEGGVRRFAQAVPDEVRAPPAGPDRSAAEPPEDVLAATRAVLVSSVEGQMMGDVPVGVFLSGGLDSSLVAAIAARYLERRGERLKTFAVGRDGSADLKAARAVAEHLGSEHHERVYDEAELVDAVPRVVAAIESFDPSLVRSAVPNYLLAEHTARHVKVVLTGEGADELFAGYGYVHELPDAEALHAELVRSVEGLHNLNLQRCDRVTMAHGLEARVPFLERDVIGHALALHPSWKAVRRERPEKALLRAAFEGLLPDDLLWRGKEQFGDGSGAGAVLRERWQEHASDAEFARERRAVRPPLRTKEELAYFRIFRDHLRGLRPEGVVGRFATA